MQVEGNNPKHSIITNNNSKNEEIKTNYKICGSEKRKAATPPNAL